MKQKTLEDFNEFLSRYPKLSVLKDDILTAYNILLKTAQNGGTVFTCGNGGSASDAEHIVGELMKKFKTCRPIKKEVKEKLASFGEDGEKLSEVLEGAIPAISLTSHISLSTAFSNDNEPKACFSQQLYGLGKNGDTLIAISTSGNSQNCVYAIMVAKALGINVISLTGAKECKMEALSDVTLKVPETETFKVQEYHLPLYHLLCAMLESEIFS